MPESLITYTGQKIKKVRWLPRQAIGELEQSTIFVTGSYDDEANSVTVWQYQESMEDEGEELNVDDPAQLSVTEPKPMYIYELPAGVMDMKFVSGDNLGVCLSNGTLLVLKHTHGNMLVPQLKMDCLHSPSMDSPLHYSPCNCIASNQFSPGTVYTGGEDGTVCVVMVDQQKRVCRLGVNETTCINSMVCISHNELLVGCSSGQLKLWDVRDRDQNPSMSLTLAKEMTSIQCLDVHPSQSHLIVAGFNGNGCICFRDMRHGKRPINMISAHTGEVWEVRFHPLYPNYLYSCSQDGSLWQWNATPTLHKTTASIFADSTVMSQVAMDTTQQQQWLTTPSSELDVSAVIGGQGNTLSVNSFDIEYKHLVGVTDQEALYFIPNQIQ